MLKKAAVIIGLLAASASPARAGIYYDLQQATSSATLRMVGAIKMYASTMGSTPVVQIEQTGFSTTKTSTFSATGTDYSISTSSGINVAAGGIYAAFFRATSKFVGDLVGDVTGNLTGNVTGNSSTATALVANGANCSAGNYPLGVDASGAVEDCTAAGIGDVVKASTQTFSGANTFTNTVSLSSGVSFGNSVNIGQQGAYLVQNSTAATMINLNGAETVWAISDDGATQSTGCVVAISMTGAAQTATLRATSTTTANLDMMDTASGRLSRPGVIIGGAGGPGTSCVPGTPCLYMTKGWARVQITNTGYSPTASIVLNFSATRCKPVGAGSPPSIATIVGYFASTTDAAGNGWMSVGP